jgi:4-aminobutyrate aminotransferase-like enzyme
VERRCKAAEAVLEEVEEKGTLVERVSDLEKRVSKVVEDER